MADHMQLALIACGSILRAISAAPSGADVTLAFTNYGISLGLQAVERHPDRVGRINKFFEAYRSGDEYGREASLT
jgi:hypothetical protein